MDSPEYSDKSVNSNNEALGVTQKRKIPILKQKRELFFRKPKK